MSHLRAFSAAVLALNFAGLPAAQAVITPVNYPTPVSTMGTISGDIVNIDPVNNMIFVKDDTGIVQAIRVDDRVQILRRGEGVRLLNLSLGDFVTISPK